MNNQKQAIYNLQVSVDSLKNDTVISLESPFPFNSIEIGNKLWLEWQDASHLFPEHEPPKSVFIVDKAHLFSDTENRIFNIVRIAVALNSHI